MRASGPQGRRTRKQGMRTVTFTIGERQYAAIGLNSDKLNWWGSACPSDHDVVQFKDVQVNIVRVVRVDGEAKEYGGEKHVPPSTWGKRDADFRSPARTAGTRHPGEASLSAFGSASPASYCIARFAVSVCRDAGRRVRHIPAPRGALPAGHWSLRNWQPKCPIVEW